MKKFVYLLLILIFILSGCTKIDIGQNKIENNNLRQDKLVKNTTSEYIDIDGKLVSKNEIQKAIDKITLQVSKIIDYKGTIKIGFSDLPDGVSYGKNWRAYIKTNTGEYKFYQKSDYNDPTSFYGVLDSFYSGVDINIDLQNLENNDVTLVLEFLDDSESNQNIIFEKHFGNNFIKKYFEKNNENKINYDTVKLLNIYSTDGTGFTQVYNNITQNYCYGLNDYGINCNGDEYKSDTTIFDDEVKVTYNEINNYLVSLANYDDFTKNKSIYLIGLTGSNIVPIYEFGPNEFFIYKSSLTKYDKIKLFLVKYDDKGIIKSYAIHNFDQDYFRYYKEVTSAELNQLFGNKDKIGYKNIFMDRFHKIGKIEKDGEIVSYVQIYNNKEIIYFPKQQKIISQTIESIQCEHIGCEYSVEDYIYEQKFKDYIFSSDGKKYNNEGKEISVDELSDVYGIEKNIKLDNLNFKLNNIFSQIILKII